MMLGGSSPISLGSVPRLGRRGAPRLRAFTLMEAVLGIVILSVTLTPLMMAVQRTATDQVAPVMISRARWLAVERLERIIADRHSAERGYDYVVGSNYPAENPISGNSDFSRSVTIVETEADLATSGDGYKTITVTVQWSDSTGQTRTLQLSTVVTEFS